MAGTAVSREAKLDVGRVLGVVEVGSVAGVAGGRGVLEYIVGVALFAGKCRMRARQRITSVLKMIKFRAEPGVYRVAAFAGGGELEPHMIDRRSQEILLMAGVARR